MDTFNPDSDERLRSANQDFKNRAELEKGTIETVYIRMDFFDFDSDFSNEDSEKTKMSAYRNYLHPFDDLF